MKKFIFGVMLLVSMLGIVGCSNPSNSDDSVPVDETEYTLINKTNASLLIAYLSSSKNPEKPKIVAVNESYTVKKRDAYTDTIGITTAGDEIVHGYFYITSNSNLTPQDIAIITFQAESFEITQEYYDNYLKK